MTYEIPVDIETTAHVTFATEGEGCIGAVISYHPIRHEINARSGRARRLHIHRGRP